MLVKICHIRIKKYYSESGENLNCLSNECWCVSAGGSTCGYSTNETCDPNECSDRDECPGYGYWCKDAGITKLWDF